MCVQSSYFWRLHFRIDLGAKIDPKWAPKWSQNWSKIDYKLFGDRLEIVWGALGHIFGLFGVFFWPFLEDDFFWQIFDQFRWIWAPIWSSFGINFGVNLRIVLRLACFARTCAQIKEIYRNSRKFRKFERHLKTFKNI